MFQRTEWEPDERWASLPDDHWAVAEDRRQARRELDVLERRLQDSERRIDDASHIGADTAAAVALMAELHAHLTADQCRHLLIDLRTWERPVGKDGPATVAAHARMHARGAFVPGIVDVTTERRAA
jgi:glutathione S-transferase